MNLRKLKIFLETANCLNMSQVARNLYISQPSVSQAIYELEESVGVKLFDRIGKKLYLTYEGKVFYQYVRRILNLYIEGTEAIKNSKEGHKGKISIGASTTIGTYILPEYIKKFYENYKEIDISLIIENTSIIEKLIMENKVDFAFVEGNISFKEIIPEPIWKDELIFICSNEHKLSKLEYVTFEQLQEEKLIMREEGSGTRKIIESYLIGLGFKYNVDMELGNTEAILRVVESGLGISCVPFKCAKERINNGSLKKININDISIFRDLYFIYHKDKLISPNMKLFVDFIKE
ncbi:selenium metabolism-associated LysR family transcriptional regulator [Clostridium tarantellae]|uniref:LysR family transcriptional regulator n=1 Tax=Clostridium tarantellae TaxID=39493 RepID=A0A6I1MLW4_9CLOT|nr:selenium metabolism-associated LysR family transcriptional regulator [Clostridium tarantellae]MPQ43222.1 LysR family transcriptional regulator [Clostridium tarantellae]